MGIEAQRAHAQLDVDHSSDATDELWAALLVDPAAFDQRALPLKELGTLAEQRGEVGAVALLLALHHEADPAGKLAQRVAQRLGGLDPMQQLALVVAHAAGIEPTVAQRGVVWRRLPQVEWRGRLHVVVLHRDQRPRAGAHLANHQRWNALLAQHRHLGARRTEPVLHPSSTALELREVVRLTRDRAEVA